MSMLKKFFTSVYGIVGIIIFLLIFGILFFAAQVPLVESLLGALALGVIAVGVTWWRENIW